MCEIKLLVVSANVWNTWLTGHDFRPNFKIPKPIATENIEKNILTISNHIISMFMLSWYSSSKAELPF